MEADWSCVRMQAFGNAAMILASGKKGCRYALPHARIMTAPPRINRSFGSTSNIMIKANELEYNTQTYVEFLSKYTGVLVSYLGAINSTPGTLPVQYIWNADPVGVPWCTSGCMQASLSLVAIAAGKTRGSCSGNMVWRVQDARRRRCARMWAATATSHPSRPSSASPLFSTLCALPCAYLVGCVCMMSSRQALFDQIVVGASWWPAW